MKKFKAKIKADILREIVDIAYAMSDEIKINVNGGIDYKIVDPSHLCMVHGDYPKLIFEEFPDDNTEFSFGLDLNDMKEILKNAKKNKGDIININYIESKQKTDDDDNPIFVSDKLEVSVGNIKNTYSTIDIDGISDPKIPTLELPNYADVNVKELKDFLKNNQSISDHFIIKWEDNKFKLIMVQENKRSRLGIPKELLTDYRLMKDDDISMFDNDYFKSILKNIESKTVRIYWGDQYPTVLEWNIAEHGKVKTLLAPRIESDD